MESLFPTLKRGANNHCAYGAFVWTLLMQSSIKPADFAGFSGTPFDHAQGRLSTLPGAGSPPHGRRPVRGDPGSVRPARPLQGAPRVGRQFCTNRESPGPWAFVGTDPARPRASSCQLRSAVSPVPKCEGPGAPSPWSGKGAGTGTTLTVVWKRHRTGVTRRDVIGITDGGHRRTAILRHPTQEACP